MVKAFTQTCLKSLISYYLRSWEWSSLLLLLFLNLPGLVFASHPESSVTIVYNRGIAPIKFTDDKGKPSGILNEYWKLLARQSDFEFTFREIDTFSESLDLVKSGIADIHAGIFYTDKRSTFLEYSEPILELKFYLYTTPGLAVPLSLDDTGGFLIGVVKGDDPENSLGNHIPLNSIVKYEDYQSMFQAVLNGEIRTFVSSDIHLNYYLSKNNLQNLFKHSDIPLFNQTYYGVTAKNNHALITAIKQAQSALGNEKKENLGKRWIDFSPPSSVHRPVLNTLTQEELEWIQEHRVLNVSNEMDWPPFDFNENGKPLGFSIDLLELISKRIGIEWEYIYGYSWNELQEMLRNKQIDVLHSLNRSAVREEFILFTSPFISNQTVIVTNTKKSQSINSVEDLNHKTIAIIDGYNQKQVLKNNLQGVKFVSVESPLAALKAVSSGQADATIRFNSVASYLINHHLLTNLNFVNEFKMEGDNLHELFLGVRNDWPVLQSILEKGLASITREEMNELKKKWFSTNIDYNYSQKINFSDEERKWIRNHPEITMGADYNWPPFDFAEKDGTHSGLSSEYIKLIEERSGLKVKIKAGVWADILEDMQKGELDGLACSVKTLKRKEYLTFTEPYLSIPTAIITKKDNQNIHSIKDLNGKTVSINESSYIHDWLKSRYPLIKLHLTTSNEASIEAVSYGIADAYIGNLVVTNYIIRKRLITNMKVIDKLENMRTEASVAIDINLPVLSRIVQKVLDSVTDQERQAIMAKWYIASTEQTVKLTKTERKWIKQHHIVKVSGDPARAPLSYLNKEGHYIGVIPDYFKLLETKSGLQFEVVPTGSWSEVLQGFQEGKIELIDAITENSKRRDLMDFTDVFMNADVAFITRDDINFLKGLDHVGNRRVATVKDYITESYIRDDYPELQLHLYPTASQGLKALSNGDVDVFVVDIPTFEHNAKKSSLSNLKISGLTPYAFSLAIGVQKEHPELLSILNKALKLISQQEKNEVYARWVTLAKPLFDYSLFIKAAFGVCIILLAFTYWNRRLAHEVSLRKEAEIEARKASKAKSDFLANMSHEIRTPMNSVLGFAELLDNMITDPEQKSYLKSIRMGGSSLLAIINDILDISKIEAGKMVLKPEPVSLQKMFEEMNECFKAKMVQKQLLFTQHLEQNFPLYIFMDGMRLRQILVNLIGNALKFTETGEVKLSGEVEQINDNPHSVSFSLLVSDTGIGIKQSQQNIIFDKFEQQEGQDSVYGGTGLGLSICRKLTHMMGGTIKVKSCLGKGSSFILHFKEVIVTENVTVQEKAKVINKSGFFPAQVLIVDDIRDNRRLITSFFNKSAVTFLEAENGEEALLVLKQHKVDLIILDLRMPIMNGYETVSIIKQDETLSSVPVIAFTASVMGEDLEKVDQYGFDGYLRKPVSQQELFRTMGSFLTYKEQETEENVGTFLEMPDIATDQLTIFAEKVEDFLLPQWEYVKDKGDFEIIDQFAMELKELSSSFGVQNVVSYAEKLQGHIASFDIIEVDGLMQQFPELLKALKSNIQDRE